MEARTPELSDTAVMLLEAAERCLHRQGLAGFSTRCVAEEARMPLSQIHYHFGSKQKLLLALLEHQNRKLLKRQASMYGQPLPLSERWMLACDYLDEDLASGYVRVLQEMIAAGWTDPEIGAAARSVLSGWYELLQRAAREAAECFGGLAGFTPAEVAVLVGNLFLGTEAMILLGDTGNQETARSAVRKIAAAIRAAEAQRGRNGT